MFNTLNLLPTTQRAIDALQFTTPTQIQAEAIPILLAGNDIIGQAHTGSGKTLAFGIPLVERCDASVKGVQALVLAPTRELAQQVGSVLGELGRFAGLTVATIYGGVGYGPQMTALERGAQIVVGTPGRVLDHLERGTLRIDSVRFLVLDEADEMLDRGFARDVERILSQTPRSRQTALFSATTPDWIHQVSAKYLNQPKVVQIDDELEEPDIEHSVIEVWSGDKMPVLVSLLNQDATGATLVFGRTRHGVVNLARRLQRLGFQVEALQGDLSQQVRDKIVERFRGGRLPILLATNVAARGLDMLNIDRVINYDLPETSDLFIHRVGRTGRIGRSGQAITLISATDLPKMREIERELGRRLPRVDMASLPPPRMIEEAPRQALAPRPAPALRPRPPVGVRPEPVAPPVAEAAPVAGDAVPSKSARRRRRRRAAREAAPVEAAAG